MIPMYFKHGWSWAWIDSPGFWSLCTSALCGHVSGSAQTEVSFREHQWFSPHANWSLKHATVPVVPHSSSIPSSGHWKTKKINNIFVESSGFFAGSYNSKVESLLVFKHHDTSLNLLSLKWARLCEYLVNPFHASYEGTEDLRRKLTFSVSLSNGWVGPRLSLWRIHLLTERLAVRASTSCFWFTAWLLPSVTPIWLPISIMTTYHKCVK